MLNILRPDLNEKVLIRGLQFLLRLVDDRKLLCTVSVDEKPAADKAGAKSQARQLPTGSQLPGINLPSAVSAKVPTIAGYSDDSDFEDGDSDPVNALLGKSAKPTDKAAPNTTLAASKEQQQPSSVDNGKDDRLPDLVPFIKHRSAVVAFLATQFVALFAVQGEKHAEMVQKAGTITYEVPVTVCALTQQLCCSDGRVLYGAADALRQLASSSQECLRYASLYMIQP